MLGGEQSALWMTLFIPRSLAHAEILRNRWPFSLDCFTTLLKQGLPSVFLRIIHQKWPRMYKFMSVSCRPSLAWQTRENLTTISTAKKVKCSHSQVTSFPFVVVLHPSVVQFGFDPEGSSINVRFVHKQISAGLKTGLYTITKQLNKSTYRNEM